MRNLATRKDLSQFGEKKILLNTNFCMLKFVNGRHETNLQCTQIVNSYNREEDLKITLCSEEWSSKHEFLYAKIRKLQAQNSVHLTG